VLDEKIIWHFPGHHLYSGKKEGVDGVITFLDIMRSAMGSSNVSAERFFMEQNDNLAVEYQHIRTNRIDGVNLDHYWCVTWKFRDGKIVEGRHLAGDQHEVDRFFNHIAQHRKNEIK
jgi:ketosteroid isomerase-like protein